MQLDRQFVQQLQSDTCRTLVDAWMGWRGDQMIAGRQDMWLADIKAILPSVTLFDVVSPEEIRIRLAASQQEQIAGRPLKGVNLLDFTAPEERAVRSRRMWSMAQQPCGGWGGFVHSLNSGLEISAEAVTLPLRPARADQPMQLITAMARVAGPDRHDEPKPGPVLRVSQDYRFLDGGAGLPDLP